METGTGKDRKCKKEGRTEVEKEDYHRKQGRYIEEKIKMDPRRKWVYTRRQRWQLVGWAVG